METRGGPWGPVGARGPYSGPFSRGPFDLVGVIDELDNLTDMEIHRLDSGQFRPPEFFSVSADQFLAR